MNAAWMGYALLLGAMLSAAAWGADAALRGAGRASRAIWLVAMATLLGGSLLATRPRSRTATVGQMRVKTVASREVAPRAPSPLDRVRRWRNVASVSASALTVRMASRLPDDTGRLLLLGWLLASAGALAVGAGVHRRIARQRRLWPLATVNGERVRISRDVGPAVVGIVNAEIVLPGWLLSRSEEEQAVVVTHESEHRRSGDHLLLGAACVGVALMPWHPAAWWMLSRLRLALELDCDARVIAQGLDAGRYGGALIDLAGRCDGFRLGATALADHTTHLERRLRAMSSTRKVARSRVLLATAVATLAVVAACEARVPTSAEVQAMDVRGVEQVTMMKSAMPDKANVRYFIDGVRSTAEQAHALPAERIASMGVQHLGVDGPPIAVYIATTSANLAAKRNDEDGSGTRGFRVKTHDSVLSPGKEASSEFTNHDTVVFNSAEFTGLIFVDGVRTDIGALKALGPHRIASVEVLKSGAATQVYSDPAARNGVLRITTKK